MHLWDTHDIHNQVDELRDYHLLQSDPALQDALRRALGRNQIGDRIAQVAA